MGDELIKLDADFAGEAYVHLKELDKKLRQELQLAQKGLGKLNRLIGQLETGVIAEQELETLLLLLEL